MPRKKADEMQRNAKEVQYVIPTNDFPFVYANNAILNLNDMDGSIVFGELVGEIDGKQQVIPKVKVMMATPFIYRLKDMLDNLPPKKSESGND